LTRFQWKKTESSTGPVGIRNKKDTAGRFAQRVVEGESGKRAQICLSQRAKITSQKLLETMHL